MASVLSSFPFTIHYVLLPLINIFVGLVFVPDIIIGRSDDIVVKDLVTASFCTTVSDFFQYAGCVPINSLLDGHCKAYCY